MYGSHTHGVKEASVTLVVQAGGRGTRLGGVPKGLLRLDGERLIDRLLRLGEGWPAWVVANDARAYEGVAAPLVGDVVPGRGAPGGVVTGLLVAATPWVLTVACDMPFVTREAMQALLDARREDADVVCYLRGGRLEPLLALYRRSLAREWLARLDAGPSLQQLIRDARFVALTPPEPRLLDSVNTPADATAAGVS